MYVERFTIFLPSKIHTHCGNSENCVNLNVRFIGFVLDTKNDANRPYCITQGNSLNSYGSQRHSTNRQFSAVDVSTRSSVLSLTFFSPPDDKIHLGKRSGKGNLKRVQYMIYHMFVVDHIMYGFYSSQRLSLLKLIFILNRGVPGHFWVRGNDK